ncbi:MAG TPA: HAD family hydrolase [Candidatus Limnocylindrales bacterium]
MTPPAAGLHARLAGLDLVVFDKDGTLIEFHAMWGGWVTDLADRLEAAAGRPLRGELFRAIGFDGVTGRADPHGGLAAMPMAVLRRFAVDVVVDAGLARPAAEVAVGRAWHAPDPVALARPVADLGRLFGALRDAGTSVGVATSDDRAPTERTLEALGIAALVDATVCADDGIPVKPDPAMVLHLCASVGADVGRTAVVGDSVSDLRMGRAAGAGLCIGVLSGTSTSEELEPFADVVLPSVAGLLAAGTNVG